MPDRDLKLNSLSRFSKQSPRLVLEEYSHCEVPAGCGGAVLRWRNPDEPIPMVVRIWGGNGTYPKLTLDGQGNLYHPKIPVSFGKHVMTFEIQGADPAFAMILLFAHLNEDYVRILQPEGETTILSLPDDTWRYSMDALEGNDWQQPDFDNREWLPMVEKPPNPHPKYYSGDLSQWTKEFTDRGAVGLGIDTGNSSAIPMIQRALGQNTMLPTVYVRKTFTVSRRAQE